MSEEEIKKEIFNIVKRLSETRCYQSKKIDNIEVSIVFASVFAEEFVELRMDFVKPDKFGKIDNEYHQIRLNLFDVNLMLRLFLLFKQKSDEITSIHQ